MLCQRTPCCHHSRHHVMSEVLLLLLPTQSLKLRPDPNVDIWVAGALRQSRQRWPGGGPSCVVPPSLAHIVSLQPPKHVLLLKQLDSYKSMAQCTPAYHHRRETVRLRLELERLTALWVFPAKCLEDFWKCIESAELHSSSSRRMMLITSETKTSLQPKASSDIERRSNWLLAKVKDTSKTKLYNNTH